MTKDRDSKKPFKNYIILIILFAVSCCITLYLCECYNVYNEYKKQTPVIRGTLSEIGYNDLDHYVVDIPSVIIYQEQFVNEFNDKYNYRIKLTGNYPAFISFKDGRVDSILQSDAKKNLTISKVDSFLEINMYEEED